MDHHLRLVFTISQFYLELDETDPGLDVDAGVPHGGIEPEILDLAEEAEQSDHLVLGGLGGDVGHLDHPGVRLHGDDHFRGSKNDSEITL